MASIRSALLCKATNQEIFQNTCLSSQKDITETQILKTLVNLLKWNIGIEITVSLVKIFIKPCALNTQTCNAHNNVIYIRDYLDSRLYRLLDKMQSMEKFYVVPAQTAY